MANLILDLEPIFKILNQKYKDGRYAHAQYIISQNQPKRWRGPFAKTSPANGNELVERLLAL